MRKIYAQDIIKNLYYDLECMINSKRDLQVIAKSMKNKLKELEQDNEWIKVDWNWR